MAQTVLFLRSKELFSHLAAVSVCSAPSDSYFSIPRTHEQVYGYLSKECAFCSIHSILKLLPFSLGFSIKRRATSKSNSNAFGLTPPPLTPSPVEYARISIDGEVQRIFCPIFEIFSGSVQTLELSRGLALF